MRLWGGGKGVQKGVQNPVQNSRGAFSRRDGLAAIGEQYARILSAILYGAEIRGRLERASRGPRYINLGVRLGNPVQLTQAMNLAEPVALQARVRAVIAQRSEVNPGLVGYQFELTEEWWQACTARDVSGAQVGITDGRAPVEFRLDPPHVLAAGSTRSGKSVLVDAMIRALLLTHSPDELRLMIADPHADHVGFGRVAHLACPVATDGADIDRVMALAGQELDRRRGARLKDGPRLVVVVDEAQQALAGKANLAIAAALAAEGAKYRVHLLAATQKPSERALPGLLANLMNRWVGLVDNARTSSDLTGQRMMGCQRLTGKGDFVHVAGADWVRLQALYVREADLAGLPMAAEPVTWPAVVEEDEPAVARWAAEEARGVGRPRLEAQPDVVGWYMYKGPRAISEEVAAARGIGRRAHELHRAFAEATIAEIKRLMAQGRV